MASFQDFQEILNHCAFRTSLEPEVVQSLFNAYKNAPEDVIDEGIQMIQNEDSLFKEQQKKHQRNLAKLSDLVVVKVFQAKKNARKGNSNESNEQIKKDEEKAEQILQNF